MQLEGFLYCIVFLLSKANHVIELDSQNTGEVLECAVYSVGSSDT